ncbi:HPP family protein [Saccharomonospora saliphila]|uniref:HPP family protein n=1 Tax=Saccharomonospora saliphila TaxID=369829 RepID=UPI00036D9773|nr:HPP family protein [Saccharomonospora saliphila]
MSARPRARVDVLAAVRRRAGWLGTAAYALVLCAVVVAVVGVVGLAVGRPYVFPSLGPTVMLFFESPLRRSASALCTLVGHAVAILVGVGALWAFGLADEPAVLAEGLTPPRVAAAATAVALTAFVLLALRCPHPPAGATTLLISLGLLTTVGELLAVVVGVVLVTVVGVALNRALGVRQALIPARDQQ